MHIRLSYLIFLLLLSVGVVYAFQMESMTKEVKALTGKVKSMEDIVFPEIEGERKCYLK